MRNSKGQFMKGNTEGNRFIKGKKYIMGDSQRQAIINGKLKKGKNGIIKDKRGYILIYSPYHPFAHNNYVYEHRLIMERSLKRFLKPSEEIHHINGIKDDNRTENLKVLSKSEHQTIHQEIKREERKAI